MKAEVSRRADRAAARTGRSSPQWLSANIAVLMLLILLARCVLVAGYMARSDSSSWLAWIMTPDSRDYVYAANDASDGRIDSASFRTPLYPVFLALTGSLAAPPWLSSVLLQQLAVISTALACGIISARACGPAAGRAAALVYSLCPLALIESIALLPDILMAMVLSWAGVAWLSAESAFREGRRSLVLATFSGLLLSLATMLKPSCGLAFIAPVGQLMLTGKDRFRSKVAVALGISIAALSLPTAWRAVNLARHGSPFLTTQDSFETAGRFLVLSGEVSQERFWSTYADSLDRQVCEGPILYESIACDQVPDGWAGLGGGRFCRSFEPAARDSMYRNLALHALEDEPLRILIGHFTNWPLFLYNPVGDLGRAGGPAIARDAVRLSSWALQFALAAGALLALVVPGTRRRAADLLLFSILTFLVTGLVTGPLAGTRYSLPFYWVLVSVASCGWTGLLCRRDR